MAEGVIKKIALGECVTECDSYTVYTDSFSINSGNKTLLTADNTVTHGEPKEYKEENTYFIKGEWKDEKGSIIKEAKIGDTVFFHIETQNINKEKSEKEKGDAKKEEVEEIGITLYDWDGWANFDDAINIVYASGPKKGQIRNREKVGPDGKIIIPLTLTEGLLPFIEDDGGEEIELYFECTYKEEVVDLPKNTEEYLIVSEKEEIVTVLIELPHSGTEDKLNRKGLAGHSAIMIGDEYYDFGPQPGEPFYSKGRPWWDQMAESGNLTKEDILKILESNEIRKDWLIIGKVYLIDIIIKESEKNKVENWWKERYKETGNYSVLPFLGEQCTTAVRISLEENTAIFNLISNDILSINYPTRLTQTPEGLLELLINYGCHTYGKYKGEKLKISKEYNELKDED